MDIFANTSESHLRAILIALCNDFSIREKAVDMAEKLATTPSATGSGSDLAMCIQCNEAFSVLAHTDGQCRYHPEDMEPDYGDDTWADAEEETHGPIDTEENRAEYPDAFIWYCCEQRGTAPGCEVGPHRVKGN